MSDERFYTVRQFAELAGVSRQTVYRHLDGLLAPFVTRCDSGVTVSEQGLLQFLSQCDRKCDSNVTEKSESAGQPVTPDVAGCNTVTSESVKPQVDLSHELVTVLQEQLEVLRSELDKKNSELDAKNEQIKNLDSHLKDANARLAEAQSMAQANAVLASQAQQLQAIETQERQEQRRRRWFRRG